MLNLISKDEFKKHFDLITAYESIRRPNSFLLLSGKNGKYSIIGYNPIIVAEAKKNNLSLKKAIDSEGNFIEIGAMNLESPSRALNILQSVFEKLIPKDKIPLPKVCPGIYGFLSYDFGVTFENIKQKVKDDLLCPNFYFILPTKLIVYDHENHILTLIALGEDKEKAKFFLDEIEKELRPDPALPDYSSQFLKPEAYYKVNNIKQKLEGLSLTKNNGAELSYSIFPSNLTYLKYKQKFNKIKNYLKKGETYQINFSQRFTLGSDIDPFEAFKKVAKINPSPFQAYFETEEFQICSNSPERLIEVHNKKGVKIITAKPIKGTIERGKTLARDQELKDKLLNSEKDNAELSMIVDLLRNDLGKVCKAGTVKVLKHREIETYSHLHHTVSEIEGELKKDKNFVDIILAVFPGGSITGCPKKRTMEIIDELEEFKRGVYCGSMGYITFDNNMEFNIMIRTIFFKDGKAYFHSGGGIVIDSDVKKEYNETITKAKALFKSFS